MENNMEDIFKNALGENEEKSQPQQPVQQVKKPASPQAILKTEVANAISQPNISDKLLASMDKLVQQGQLTFPKGYQLGNELKSAYFKITSNPILASCNPSSIANALSDMVIQGLSVQRNQGYLIPYNGQLSFQRSYFGDIMLAKRTGLITEVNARVIYDGDTCDTDTDELGNEYVKYHKSSIENHDNAIVGAYAWVTGINGYKLFAIMTKKEIEANWSLSKDSSRKFQKTFPQEASKRTVIRRLLKNVFNTAVDLTEEQRQAIELYNKGVDDEYKSNSGDFKYSSEDTINAHVHEEAGEIISDSDF